MSGAIMLVCRLVGVVLVGIGATMLAEWARVGVITGKGEAFTTGVSIVLVGTALVIGFLLLFGGARQ